MEIHKPNLFIVWLCNSLTYKPDLFMKKILCAIALVMGLAGSASAQVDNYALKLTPEGSVNVYKFPELNELSSYSIQFWINVDSWQEGALIYDRGGDFKASLGKEGTVNFQAGSTVLAATSADLAAGKWAQITMIANGSGAQVLVNNVQAGSIATAMTIPASEKDMILGGGMSGRLDEFRVWKAALSNAEYDGGYQYFIYNTINKYNPQWSDLVAYYKFDQNQCDNVVDYTFTYHHGSFSDAGATRDIVTDNDRFKYRLASAYCDFSRFFDRGEYATRDKYLLANDLIVIGINSYSDGHLKVMYPYSEGELVNAEYMPEFEGRTGVLSLDGTGVGMNAGVDAMAPETDWAFHTWIYLDEWTPGAYILKKETADNLNGLSIRLGNASGEAGQITVRINGHDFPMNGNPNNAIPVGEWVSIAVRSNVVMESQPQRTIQFMVNGRTSWGATGQCGDGTISFTPAGAANEDAVIGENLKAKLDETVIWHGSPSTTTLQTYIENGSPMPGLGINQTANVMHDANAYWKYDDAENPGYDYYSYKHFIGIMRSAYEGYRGYKIRLSVSGHTGWETTISDVQKRKIFAADLAEIAKDPILDGVELDLEWCYDQTCFNNYGMLLEEIRTVLPADKVFGISPHAVSYAFPKEYLDNCDLYTFQIYGPGRNQFTWSNYTSAYNNFINQGFPKDKIVMSFATTTSRGWQDGAEVTTAAPIGVKDGLLDGDYTPDKNEAKDNGGLTRYFTGFNQTYDRTKFARDNDLLGIFYWDMGNDVKMDHKYNLTKAASFAINSNVDTVVTHVDVYPDGSGVQLIKRDEQARRNATIDIYPNPALDGNVTLAVPEGEEAFRVSVYDAQGVCKLQRETAETALNVDSLGAGVYFVTVLTRQGHTYTGRLVRK